MTTSEFDSYFPAEYAGPRRRRRRGAARDLAARGTDWLTGRARGRGEQPVVPEPEFSSYYGQGVVKAVPWRHEISVYLFTGGVAGGSGLLAVGAHLAGHDALRFSARLTALAAAGASGVALIADLGRPERFLNMLRTLKLTSPMSVGTWIFSGYSASAGLAAACEVDRVLGGRRGGSGLPVLGALLRPFDAVGTAGLALFSAPLAAYTAVLLSDTATPVWFESRRHLPQVFVSSAAMASGGVQMVLLPTGAAGPARRLAALGALGDLVAVHRLEQHLEHEGVLEPLHTGHPGTMMRTAKACVVGGGLGVLAAGALRGTPAGRLVSVASGLALAAASALTRFAVVEGGQASARDPRFTVEPQRRRLAARRAAGQVGDSITT